MGGGAGYPRALSSIERELLLWILPGDRPGYAAYRGAVERWDVVAAGRGGEGSYVLAEPGWTADTESSLTPVFAYGALSSPRGTLSVAVRERTGGQIEFEITGNAGVEPSDLLQHGRRWTYSEWVPSQPCPCCSRRVREVVMRTVGGRVLGLAICAADRRIWLHDAQTGVNTLLSLMGFYSELMLQQGIKDPKVALDPKRFFQDLDSYSSEILGRAVGAYTMHRSKTGLEGGLVFEREESQGWIRRAIKMLRPKRVT